MRQEAVSVVSGDTATPGEITVIVPAVSERLGKAIGLGLLLLVVTAVSALIPVVHFIIVPVFLLLTIGVVISCLRGAEVITEGHGSCPVCKAPFRVMRRRYRLPFSDVCEGCGRQVVVKLSR